MDFSKQFAFHRNFAPQLQEFGLFSDFLIHEKYSDTDDLSKMQHDQMMKYFSAEMFALPFLLSYTLTIPVEA